MFASTSATWRARMGEPARHTTRIARDQQVGVGGRDLGQFTVEHSFGDAGLLHGEESTEAAAFVAAG
jgi:hypothetical protein